MYGNMFTGSRDQDIDIFGGPLFCLLKLKLQYFGHLTWRTDSFEKTLMLVKIEGGRRRGQQRMRWLDGITNSMDISLSKLGVGDGQGGLVSCSPWGHKESDTTERLNWLILLIGASQVVLAVKNPPANAGDIRDTGSVPGLGKSSGGGHGNPLQYSCLENATDRELVRLQSIGS